MPNRHWNVTDFGPKVLGPVPDQHRIRVVVRKADTRGCVDTVLLRPRQQKCDNAPFGHIGYHAQLDTESECFCWWRAVGITWNLARITPAVNVAPAESLSFCWWRAVGITWNHAGITPAFSIPLRPNPCFAFVKLNRNHMESRRNHAFFKDDLSKTHTSVCRPDINIYY